MLGTNSNIQSNSFQEQPLFKKLSELIQKLRKNEQAHENWPAFKTFVEENLEEICASFNSRWLISIADTYADYGNAVERRNALYISLIANMEKLFASRMLQYDISINEARLKLLKQGEKAALWDGMTSFNYASGNMTNNMFRRVRSMMKVTPSLEIIFENMLARLEENETTLAEINKYHKNLFRSEMKVSGVKLIIRKLRKIFR